MKALVTGASGFVGSHLVKKLLQKKIAVRILQRKNSTPRNQHNHSIETVIADYTDIKSLEKAVKGVDIIFHVGGVTKALNKQEYYSGNALSTRNLLKAATVASPKITRFLLVSSLAAAGPTKTGECAIDEYDIPQPVETYGRSKLAAELITYSYSHSIPVSIIRPPTVFGPRDVDCFKIFQMINNHTNLFYGNASKMSSIIYIDDLTEGIIQAALSKKAINKTFFLCNDSPTSWRNFQNVIKKSANKWTLTIHLPPFFIKIATFFGELKMKISGKASIINREKAKLGKPKYWICSNQRAKKELGFKPTISLTEGVRRTLDWYKKNNWL